MRSARCPPEQPAETEIPLSQRKTDQPHNSTPRNYLVAPTSTNFIPLLPSCEKWRLRSCAHRFRGCAGQREMIKHADAKSQLAHGNREEERGHQCDAECENARGHSMILVRRTDYLLSLGELVVQKFGDLFAVLGCKIPVHCALQAFTESEFWLPSEKFLRKCVIADAIERAGGHIRQKLDLRLVAREFADHIHGVDAAHTFHGAEVDGGAVVYFFAGKDGSLGDIVNVGPIANLCAIAPDLEWVLLNECASDHGNNGMVLDAAGTVDGEVAARHGFQSMFTRVSLESEFPHEFRPAIHVVGVVGALCEVFGEIDFFFDIGLQEIRIDATGRCKNDFLDASLQRFGENEPIEKEVCCGAGLVQVDVTASAVVGGE